MARLGRKFRHWLKQSLVALDQLGNALMGGWADETMSSRLWRNRSRQGWKQARLVLDGIARLFGDPDHCRAAYESEQKRLQQPPELRG